MCLLIPPQQFSRPITKLRWARCGPAEFGIQSFPAQVSPMGFDDLIAIDEEVHVVGDVVA